MPQQNKTCFSKKNVYLIFGIGSTGIASIAFCRKHNLHFFVACDDKEKLGNFTKFENINIEESNKIYDYNDNNILKEKKITTIILSPSVHAQNKPHKIIEIAKKNNIEIIPDIDLFYCYLKDYNKKYKTNKQIIAITGTNGKSTTTALIAHILNGCHEKQRAIACGNIGLNCLLLDTEKYDFFVVEMSSYNLYLAHYAQFDCSVLLNITEDHIEYHGTMKNYANAKAKILLNSKNAVICIDDEWTKNVYKYIVREINNNNKLKYDKQKKSNNRLQKYNNEQQFTSLFIKQHVPEKCICVSRQKILSNGLSWRNDIFYKNSKEVMKCDFTNLPGKHNIENILCSIAVALRYKISFAIACKVIKKFTSLPHRLQLVRTINGIDFINDSKGTNADSTQKALQAYSDRNVYLIAGGKRKTAGILTLEDSLENVKYVFLIGEASDSFADELDYINNRHKIKIPYQKCKTISNAVNISFQKAKDDLTNLAKIMKTEKITKSDLTKKKNKENIEPAIKRPVVLLSPLCASFDQYKSFEERGDDFCNCVKKIKS